MPDTRLSMRAVGAGALIGVLLGGALVWRAATAMYVASTSSAGGWESGSVTITDDDSGDVAFDSTQLVGGQSLTRCVTATYTGTITSGPQVRLYGAVSGALADHLDLTVDEGTGGSFAGCSGFAVGTTLYSGLLSAFPTSFATGVSTWSPSTTPVSRVYRFTVTVRSTVSAQNLVAAGSFTWEAQA